MASGQHGASADPERGPALEGGPLASQPRKPKTVRAICKCWWAAEGGTP